MNTIAPNVQCLILLIAEMVLEVSYFESFLKAGLNVNSDMVHLCDTSLFDGLFPQLSVIHGITSGMKNLIEEYINSLATMNLEGVCIGDNRMMTVVKKIYERLDKPCLAYITPNLDTPEFSAPFTCWVTSMEAYNQFVSRSLVKHIPTVSLSVEEVSHSENIVVEKLRNLENEPENDHEMSVINNKLRDIKKRISLLKLELAFYYHSLGDHIHHGIVVDTIDEVQLISRFNRPLVVKLHPDLKLEAAWPFQFERESVDYYDDDIRPDYGVTSPQNFRIGSDFSGFDGLTRKLRFGSDFNGLDGLTRKSKRESDSDDSMWIQPKKRRNINDDEALTESDDEALTESDDEATSPTESDDEATALTEADDEATAPFEAEDEARL